MPSGHSTRAEEAYEPEPPADDDIRTDADASGSRRTASSVGSGAWWA
ncbi:hypothetical protein [Streptomyces alfalfae]|uniref:Uncharacterized protein n=1 Tax=Streptomyces alfalfae TaxID=1642299 RepID=A0A7T4U1H3_9ACTN|nr:hypothetical protein I8755_36550 [Streptomyces alfalfae]